MEHEHRRRVHRFVHGIPLPRAYGYVVRFLDRNFSIIVTRGSKIKQNDEKMMIVDEEIDFK